MRLLHIYYRTCLLMALSLVLLCGCVKNDPAVPAGRHEILFSSPVMSNVTKAVPGNLSAYPTGEKFTVFARYTSGDFENWDDAEPYMEATDAAYDALLNGWTTKAGSSGLTYYWPNSGKLTFAAYSPSDCTGDMTSWSYGPEGFVFTNFSVDPEPSQQYDLLYAPRAMNKTSSSMGSSADYDGVELNFRHALSCIEFRVRNGSNYEGSEVRIKNIEVLNAYQSGSFAENIDVTDESVYDASPEWTGQSLEYGTGYKVAASDVDQLVEEEAKALADARPLLLMPQDFKHPGSNVTIRITYEAKSAGVWIEQPPALIDLVTGFDSDNNGEGDTYFNDGTNPITGWESGKRYTYMITFGRYKIFFTPSVSEWVDLVSPPVYI